MQYSTGNWTVSSLVTDSNTETKNVAVPNLSWSDYARTQDEPNEAIVANTTGLGINPPETVRFAYSKVTNVYSKTNIDAASRAPVQSGVQVMTEIKLNLRATNTVSGQEIELPFTGRLVLVIPHYMAVTEEAVDYALKRTIAAQFGDDGSTTAARILELARGSLLPDNV